MSLLATHKKKRAKPRHLESKLQQSCVKWFRLQFPKLKMNLFAIPNGGTRGGLEASIMQGEGVTAGVADMLLAVANMKPPKPLHTCDNGINWYEREVLEKAYSYGLFLEFKVGKNTQTDSQKAFEKSVTEQGYRYEIIKDFDSFKNLVEEYLAK